ncbi:hypothetical protein SDC9_118035 [bioreactor metagenome]|uniref:Uncharacterized protein n=1 Tax=bioreactor metagenome TaxID=1076179 RepID=A0A645C0D6_9ZZZZ
MSRLDDAVDGHLVPRPDPDQVADRQPVQRHLLLGAVRGEAPGGGRREVEQGPDRPRGLLAGAQFQHLAERDQDGDDGGGLEVDLHQPLGGTEGGRERAGNQQSDQAVGVRRPDAERDQGEHVELAGDQGAGAPGEERRAGPHHHRGRQDELDPLRHSQRDHAVQGRDERHQHRQQQHRQGQGGTDPEPAAHVDQLGVGPRRGRHHHRFECHAAPGAAARPGPADLRVHRAGVLDVRPGTARMAGVLRSGVVPVPGVVPVAGVVPAGVGTGGGRVREVGHVRRGIGLEAAQTPVGAEVVRTAIMDGAVGRGGVDRHPADRIDDADRRARVGLSGHGVPLDGFIIPLGGI